MVKNEGYKYMFALPSCKFYDFFVQEQVHMQMSCPGKVTALAVTMNGVYCAAGIGGTVHIWEVSK